MTNFRFKYGYKSNEIINYIENSMLRNIPNKEIKNKILFFCETNPHERTIQSWFKEADLRIKHKYDNQYMKKCKTEYLSKKIKSSEENLLDEMYSKARSLGLIN